jgi:hypothetical protein
MSKGKFMTHRNVEQRENITHIVSLREALDKPLHFGKLSLVVEESFHIMDSEPNCSSPQKRCWQLSKKGHGNGM